jgi:hypothetical protein
VNSAAAALRDSRSFTIQPGADPVLLTEYMPASGALVINTGTAGVVALGTNSAVLPSTGVPLEPGTAVPWITPGQLWAYLDPTTTSSPVTVYLTSNIAGWTPSPAAIAAAAALAIAAQGIPSVYVAQQLDNIAMPIGYSKIYQVGTYASLLLHLTNEVAGQMISLTFLWYSDAAATQFIAGDQVALGNHPIKTMAGSWEIPVRGVAVKIINNAQSLGKADVIVVGTNRPVGGIKQILTTQMPRVLGFTAQNVTANIPVPLTNLDGLGDYTSLNGQCVAGIAVSAGNTGQAVFFYTEFNCTEGGLGVGAVAAANGAQATFNHPNIPVRWQWIPSITTANVTLSLILMPAGPT